MDANINKNQDNKEQLTLGKKLRAITDNVVAQGEKDKLTEMLLEQANKGLDRLHFDDLRVVAPKMIMAETLWDWLRENEIQMTGSCDQTTGKYTYTLFW